MTRIPKINEMLLAERSGLWRIAITLAAVIVPTLLRIVLSAVAHPLTFVTYYPAVLICSLLCGWRYGSACAVICGAVAIGFFFDPSEQTITVSAIVSLSIFLAACAAIIATGNALRLTVRELASQKEAAQFLNQELQHRVGNMLTVVQALAAKSATSTSPQAFVEALNGRLMALAKAHRLLGATKPQTCELGELVNEACEPFCDGANIVKTGPTCLVPQSACVPLVLAIHELCTNALKHGALATATGQVSISWSLVEDAGEVVLVWQESGGPTVKPPTRKGLGSALLRPQSSITAIVIDYQPEGVRCTLTVTGAELAEPGLTHSVSPGSKGQPLVAATA